MLALHLAPFMDELVSNAQSDFIKGRSIHDKSMYVKDTTKKLHKKQAVVPTFQA
jgi:hypothetical protein